MPSTNTRNPARRWSPHRTWQQVVLLVSLLAIVGGVALTTGPAAQAADRVIELVPQAMTFTDKAAPRTNNAGAGRLVLSNSQYQSFVNYDTSSVGSAQVVSAELKVRTQGSKATKPGLVITPVATGWSASSVTYANRPATTGKALDAGSVVPRANASLTIGLKQLSVTSSGVALSLSYAPRGTEVHLAKSPAPVLRLTVRPKTTTASAAPAISTAAASPSSLPYAMAPIKSTSRKVFAHYLPPYPRSMDNKAAASDYYTTQFMNPNGEKGKFKKVGGLLRDRPLGRAPISGDYKMADAIAEVNQAKAAGIDGFTVDLMGFTGANWDRTIRLAQAARRSGTGFVIVPNLDLVSNARNVPIPTMANKLAELYKEQGTYRLADGRYVLSSFMAEGKSVAWWQSLMKELQTKHNVRVAFVGVFLSLTDARIKQYAPISYALSIWGMRTPKTVTNGLDLASKVRRAGVKWMAPVAVQDVRHRSLVYAEAGNTETLRASWDRAIKDRADLVQLVSWNDYSESTHFAPSTAHGWTFLDLGGYYLTRWKLNKSIPITGDEVIVSNRIQRFKTKPTSQSGSMDWTLSGTSVKPRDTAEVVTMLKAPAVVTFRVGSSVTSFTAPAGVHARTVALHSGVVSASVSRSGKTVASVTSPHRVLDSIKVWDLQYYAASSRR